jgi:hypothetical protein
MRREGHVARVGNSRSAYRILVGRSDGNNHLEDTGGDEMILKWILMWDREAWLGLLWLRTATGCWRL